MDENQEQLQLGIAFEELENLLEQINEPPRMYARIPKRYLRDNRNPFEFFYEETFIIRFRFTKEQVMHYLLPIILEDLQKANNRGLPVSPVMQLLMALRFYASASYQTVTGDLCDYSQATVCVCIKKVSVAFARKLNQYILFPATVDGQIYNIRMFYKIANFPNVAACIDGTLIKVARCKRAFAEIFRSRKGFFSLNILAAVGPRGEFLFIDVRHPGSIHDSTCFDRSALKLYFEENRIQGLLLGDNGYASHPYLLVPVLRPATEAEPNYNRSHIKTRNVIERTFGRWKRKFSCLSRGLKNNLDNNIVIICATAVLWNLHIHLNYPNEQIAENVRNAVYLDNFPLNNNGLNFRTQFIARHFL